MTFSAKLWVRQIRTHELTRLIGGMMTLTLVGQGLYVLAAPFIGRLYGPDEIGYFGLFITAAAALGIFAAGFYDLAIPTARDDEEAARLSGICIFIGTTFGVISGISFAAATMLPSLGVDKLPLWSGALMGIAVASQAYVLVGQAWAIRNRQVVVIGRAHLIMNGVRSAFQVTCGFFLPLWSTLAIGEIFARAVQALHLAAPGTASPNTKYSWAAMRTLLWKHRRFPFIFGPSSSMEAIATVLQTGMLGALFGPAEMGQYFLMRRTLDLPVAFAFRSLSDALFSKQIQLVKDAPHLLNSFFLKSSITLAIIGFVLGWPLLFWGDQLFRLVYGPGWELAGQLAAVMLIPLILNLAVAPVARVFQLSQLAYLRLVPSAIALTGTVMLIVAASIFELGLIETVAGIAIVSTLQYISYFISGMAASKNVMLG